MALGWNCCDSNLDYNYKKMKNIFLILFLLISFGAGAVESWLCASHTAGAYSGASGTSYITRHYSLPVDTTVFVDRYNNVSYTHTPRVGCVKEHNSDSTSATNNYSATQYRKEKKYLGLYKRELLVIALSIGIAFAIADYQIRINANSIKVSIPIE